MIEVVSAHSPEEGEMTDQAEDAQSNRTVEWLGRWRPAATAGVLALVALAACGVLGLAFQQPWLFPSLGPTVMLFFESPRVASGRPVNSLVGHGIGLLAGIALLLAFGLHQVPAATIGGLTLEHVAAGALSVAVTSLLLEALGMQHPPAGATTLIVSLGILTGPAAWATMAAAIVLTTVLGWGLNRLRGVRSPD